MSLFVKVFVFILFPIIKLIIYFSGWNLNVEKEYKNIPVTHKTYLSIKEGKGIYDDGLFKGSLHRKIQSTDKKESNKHKFLALDTPSHCVPLEMLEQRDNPADNQNTITGLIFFTEFLKKAVNKIENIIIDAHSTNQYN